MASLSLPLLLVGSFTLSLLIALAAVAIVWFASLRKYKRWQAARDAILAEESQAFMQTQKGTKIGLGPMGVN